MEHDRRLRFLIPPFVFFASLLWGSMLDPHSHLLQRLVAPSLGQRDLFQLIPLVLAGGVAVVAMGFLISAIAIAGLRLIFIGGCLTGWTPGGYEANVPKSTFPALWKSVTESDTPVERDMLYAVGAYDHWRLPRELHEWRGRRWNTFMVSVNCCVAIGLAHFVVSRSPRLGVGFTETWCLTDAAMMVALLVNGLIARRQTLRMLGFAAKYGLHTRT